MTWGKGTNGDSTKKGSGTYEKGTVPNRTRYQREYGTEREYGAVGVSNGRLGSGRKSNEHTPDSTSHECIDMYKSIINMIKGALL